MNSFGSKFRIHIFGESHGEMIGVVLDGVPSGIPLTPESFAAALDRRRSGARGTTPRKESDLPHLLSGVYQGRTTGAPLTIGFHNENQQSEDYSQFQHQPRPGHADYTAACKFHSFNDPRGGGHFSGRLTLALVSAGVVARLILETSPLLKDRKLEAQADIVRIGGRPKDNDTVVEEVIREAMAQGDSIGAVIECAVRNLPAGLGEPFFDSVESVISHLAFSIPGVRGIEFGDGFQASEMKGSEHNDPILDAEGHPSRNGAGGVNGGITNGNDLLFRVAFKPTSSIAQAQRTFDFARQEVAELKIGGRHDVCFALRCPVIVESIAYIALAQFISA